MTSDLSAIAVLLPQPLLDRLETLRQSRNLASIQEAVLIALSDYFASQPSFQKTAQNTSSPIEARLARAEALLSLLSDRVNRLEGYSQPPTPIDSDLDDIEDEPDEVLHSFLEPEPPPVQGNSVRKTAFDRVSDSNSEQAISFGQNLGWAILPNGKVQPLTDEEIEDEPDEILYDFLDQ